MEGQIRRLAAAAEGLELQARELRAEIRDLAEQLKSQASRPAEPSRPADEAPPAVRPAIERADPPSRAEAAPQARPEQSADSEGARLVALSMALDGKAREETARHLRESFGLDDVDDLLADVYSRAGA
jgi:hypothetical protein